MRNFLFEVISNLTLDSGMYNIKTVYLFARWLVADTATFLLVSCNSSLQV